MRVVTTMIRYFCLHSYLTLETYCTSQPPQCFLIDENFHRHFTLYPPKRTEEKRTRIPVFIISIISITACISLLNLFLNIQVANFDLKNQSYLVDDGIEYELSSLDLNQEHEQHEERTLQFYI